MSEEKEFTTGQIRQVLDLELGPNDSGEATVRGYLLRLLRDVWTQGEGFDGKRPFGNSSWDYDLKVPMVKAGLVNGELDEDGDVTDLDDEAADTLILAAIKALDAPRETAAAEPVKVIIVTEAPFGDAAPRESQYDADMWSPEPEGALHVLRSAREEDPIIARYERGSWLSVREHGATTGDPYFTQGRKLAIALDALREMREHGDEAASEALAQIEDVDL